jgi:hypothetical protein
VLERATDVRHHIAAIHSNWPRGSVAQRDVQHRAVFGDVDRLTREHPVPQRLDLALARERMKQAEGVVGDEVLRIIHQHIAKARGVTLETARIAAKPFAQVPAAYVGAMRLELLPASGVAEGGHGVPVYAGLKTRATCGVGDM